MRKVSTLVPWVVRLGVTVTKGPSLYLCFAASHLVHVEYEYASDGMVGVLPDGAVSVELRECVADGGAHPVFEGDGLELLRDEVGEIRGLPGCRNVQDAILVGGQVAGLEVQGSYHLGKPGPGRLALAFDGHSELSCWTLKSCGWQLWLVRHGCRGLICKKRNEVGGGFSECLGVLAVLGCLGLGWGRDTVSRWLAGHHVVGVSVVVGLMRWFYRRKGEDGKGWSLDGVWSGATWRAGREEEKKFFDGF